MAMALSWPNPLHCITLLSWTVLITGLHTVVVIKKKMFVGKFCSLKDHKIGLWLKNTRVLLQSVYFLQTQQCGVGESIDFMWNTNKNTHVATASVMVIVETWKGAWLHVTKVCPLWNTNTALSTNNRLNPISSLIPLRLSMGTTGPPGVDAPAEKALLYLFICVGLFASLCMERSVFSCCVSTRLPMVTCLSLTHTILS